MTYQQCLDYFYQQLPMYHRVGAAALKPNLDNIRLLCSNLGNPQTKFPAIHVAGTNGKGSCTHMLAAILQTAGYKTGLHTSPHIKDFRERVKINGKEISKDEVVRFVEEHRPMMEKVRPSFFELTVALAFLHFARQQVDIAVIEVGLGGRLDSTNVIIPLVSAITNIGFDHSDLLGKSLNSIAKEKAGIIKSGVPVVIGERHPETDAVFLDQAANCSAPLYFAQDDYRALIRPDAPNTFDVLREAKVAWKCIEVQLSGPYQSKNIPLVLKTMDLVSGMGYPVKPQDIQNGLKHVVDLTGIKGRWQILSESPKVICDTGHNKPAMEYILTELQRLNAGQLHMVLGFVSDKDIRGMLELMPTGAIYYFCKAKVPRSLDAQQLAEAAREFGLNGKVIPDINQALETARTAASDQDLIFVGGSTFVVAELNELN